MFFTAFICNGTVLYGPDAAGSADDVLVSNGDGTTSFVALSTLITEALPAGAGTEIQYRADTDSFGAITGSSYNGSLVTFPNMEIVSNTGDSLLQLTSNDDIPHFIRMDRDGAVSSAILLSYSGTGGGVIEMWNGIGQRQLRIDTDVNTVIHPYGGNIGIGVGVSAPLTTLTIGSANVNNSVDCVVLVTRSVTGTSGNGHAFSDSSQVNRSGTIGYNSFDGRVNITGNHNYDHYAAFQSLPVIAGAGTMNNAYGFYAGVSVSTGRTITEVSGLHVENPTGVGTVGTCYGVYIHEQTKGSTNNYAIYTQGATQSYLGGNLTVDGKTKHKSTYQTIVDDVDGATITFDLNVGDTHTVTLSGNRTLALSNVSVGQRFLVKLKQDGSGNRTVTWWSGISWAGGSVPTLTTTGNKADWFGFICTGSGTYDGFVIGQNI